MTGGHQDPERVLAEQQRRDLGRGELGPADSDVQAAVDQLLVLLGHADLDLMDDQVGVAGLDLVQDLRHRVIAGVDDPDAQRRGGAYRAPCHRRGAVRVRQDLPRLDQEHRPGSSQRDVVRAAVDEADAQLTFEPLHLLAQRRLDDVLPLRCPAEVQLLGQRYEIAELAQLHTRRQAGALFIISSPEQPRIRTPEEITNSLNRATSCPPRPALMQERQYR